MPVMSDAAGVDRLAALKLQLLSKGRASLTGDICVYQALSRDRKYPNLVVAGVQGSNFDAGWTRLVNLVTDHS